MEWVAQLAQLTPLELQNLVMRLAGMLDKCAGKERAKIDAGIGEQIGTILARRSPAESLVREFDEIDDDFDQAIGLLNEEESQAKLFLLATLLRQASEAKGSSKRAAADYVLGYLKPGKRR